MPTTEAIEKAAAELRHASAAGVPCAPIRDLLSGGDVSDAYAVQRCNTDRDLAAGRRPVGWKIGLTSKAVQAQLGVDQPDVGILFADTAAGDDEPIERARLLQPRVEAEIAFVLEHDILQEAITAVDIIRATAFVLPAIEIVDSRVEGWDITILDTVADNASSGMFVVGNRPVRLGDVDLRTAKMTMHAGDELISEGSGAACLAHPVNAVLWLARTLAGLGQPLRSGDVVLSGALGPMRPAVAGTTYEAWIDGLGSVRANFSEEA